MAAGAVISIALTVGGIILTVHISNAKKEAVLRLQDQIYLADGKDYREILTFFELAEKDLIMANDKLVAAGHQIGSDQDAADYLAALILALSKKSEKVQYQLSLL
jgi:divalent metal cation (Fe/Co/Zn/Cd) transporter